MVFQTPTLTSEEREVLAMIEKLRDDLQNRVAEPRRWSGGLRRLSFARAVQASNSIEGYNASLDDVVAAVDGEEPTETDSETQTAVEGYRDAMTYVLQLAQEPPVLIDEGLIKALHFMMMKHDLAKSPGLWRPGAIFVRSEPSGEIVYEGPDFDLVPDLIAEMLTALQTDESPVLIRAAMAHLDFVMIHPFRDGNGRMARCLQTLVLACERILAPVFSSIEEYLGRNTPAYYAVLAEVGQGHWNPEGDARPWIRFCLTAHYRQARTHLRRIEEAEELWLACADRAERAELPERAIGPLWEGAMGFRLRNARYRAAVKVTAGDEISDLTASRDLKALVGAGLIIPVGERRGRQYLPAEELTGLRTAIRNRRPPRDDDDPFVALARETQFRQLEIETE